jgi:Holliday junction resolvase
MDASQRGKRSRNKGKRGERELAHKLQELGFPDAKRAQQFCGKAGDADVIGVPGVHIECKRVEKLNLSLAMEQATSDAREGEAPMVFHRKNNGPWLVTMRLEDWAPREHGYIDKR